MSTLVPNNVSIKTIFQRTKHMLGASEMIQGLMLWGPIVQEATLLVWIGLHFINRVNKAITIEKMFSYWVTCQYGLNPSRHRHGAVICKGSIIWEGFSYSVWTMPLTAPLGSRLILESVPLFTSDSVVVKFSFLIREFWVFTYGLHFASGKKGGDSGCSRFRSQEFRLIFTWKGKTRDPAKVLVAWVIYFILLSNINNILFNLIYLKYYCFNVYSM